MSTDTNRCPALIISAPASGQGKTSITAAVARYHRNQGRRVAIFKTGPDFIDPMILQQASGLPVYQLDPWMLGKKECQQRLAAAAATHDLILIEGVMGLYDGEASTASLAIDFNIPVATVINVAAMAETAAAIALGLATLDDRLPYAGMIANNVASDYHGQLIARLLPESIKLLARFPRQPELALPERHLGLVQAEEIDNLDERLDKLAELINDTSLALLPDCVDFETTDNTPTDTPLSGIRIGVANDAAFRFIYPANIDLLKQMGAEICFFSPLADTELPDIHSLWLPGGYPELHLDALSSNKTMKQAIQNHIDDNKPVFAECGGMLYLCESLSDKDGNKGSMIGALPGKAQMQPKLASLGMQQWQYDEQSTIRGHTFHYSRLDTELNPVAQTKTRSGRKGEAIYRHKTITASYMHSYFPSSPEITQRLFTGQLDK
ncbi:MAG: cobyrinate a,c-diamide synthase [Proteobacteria bacterium]|nr:cobyrinate a,c-diamide synthase [Pseudomonadota bacterium]